MNADRLLKYAADFEDIFSRARERGEDPTEDEWIVDELRTRAAIAVNQSGSPLFLEPTFHVGSEQSLENRVDYILRDVDQSA